MADEAMTVRAFSFGGIAEPYNRYRPPAPASAVEWLLPSPCQTALDLGAGTGALSRRLAERAARVLGIEPDPRMLQVLVDRSPGVVGVQAVAEYLPVADRSVEAVTVSSAWHWMDTGTTSAEIARVLRPDGVLGILWNGPNRSVDWVGQLLEGGDRPAADADGRRDRHRVELPPGAPFEDLETCVITWSLPMTREELVGLTGTYSRVITLPPDQRAVEMAHIEDRVAASPLLSGQSAIEMPMSCRCWRAIRQ